MSCKGCKWYLGAGCCQIHCELECREGGGYELYEPKERRDELWQNAECSQKR